MLDEKNKTQVSEGYYKRKKYNSLERFISYFYQIDSIESLPGVKTVFEIGPGSKLVSNELKKLGYEVTTCDFDKSLEPDIVCDVRDLPKDKKYDAILACQILEHVPYDDFEKTLVDLAEITNKYVVISLPERHTGFELITKFPFIQTIFKKKFFDLSLRLPVKFPGFAESSQHYFEIDGHKYPIRRIRQSLMKSFTILGEFNPPLNKYHKFFLLEKLQ